MLLNRATAHLRAAVCLPFTWEASGMEVQAPGLCALLMLQSGPQLCALPVARERSSSSTRGLPLVTVKFSVF